MATNLSYFSINAVMLPKFRKASDKAMMFLRDKALPSLFCSHRHLHMVTDSPSPPSSKVQTLYELCRKTFTPSGSPSSSQAISTLCSLIDTVTPADVGLQEGSPDDDRGLGLFGLNVNRMGRWAQPITYLDIYEGDSLTICIFCFPTSSVIPLHDHPGMTVFSKVLYGSMHVKAYDWVEPSRSKETKGPGHASVKLAKLAVDRVLTPSCGTSVLYPKTGGNLHCFTALTPCAVLDILTPPYREDEGRRCSYYVDYPYSTFSDESEAEVSDKIDNYAWLAEIDTPEDLYMRPENMSAQLFRFRLYEDDSVSADVSFVDCEQWSMLIFLDLLLELDFICLQDKQLKSVSIVVMDGSPAMC